MLKILGLEKANGLEKPSFWLLVIIAVYAFICELLLKGEPSQTKEFYNIQSSNWMLSFYVSYFQIIWILGYLSAIFFMARRFYVSFSCISNFPKQILIAFGMSIAFLALSLLVGVRTEGIPERYFTVVLAAFSFLALCIGWLVSTQLTRKYEETKAKSAANQSKKNHTINLVMQLSISPEFQKHCMQIRKVYPKDVIIPKEDVVLYIQNSGELSEEKREAITSIMFVCDQYEFMSYGILVGDFDATTVYNIFYGAMFRTWKKSSILRDVFITGGGIDGFSPRPKAYEHLTSYMTEYSKKYDKECGDAINALPKNAN